MKFFGLLRNGFRNSWLVRQARYQKDSTLYTKAFSLKNHSLQQAEKRLEYRKGEKHEIDNADEN